MWDYMAVQMQVHAPEITLSVAEGLIVPANK